MLIKKLFGLLLIYWYLSTSLWGQSSNIGVTHYGIEHGISHNLVVEIKQDLFGFIWLGTPNGLNRFDGNEFLSFSSFGTPPQQLSENYIHKLAITKSGELAIAYNNNTSLVDFLNPINFEVNSVKIAENLGVGVHVLKIFLEEDGHVYVLWEQNKKVKISKLTDEKEFELVHELEENITIEDQYISFIKLKNEDFVLRTGAFEFIKINRNGVIHLPIMNVDKSIIELPRTVFLKEDQKGRVWLSLEDIKGVYLLDEPTNTFNYFKTPLGRVNIAKLWEDQKGNLIFGKSDKILFAPIDKLALLDLNGDFHDFSFFNQIGKYIIQLESEDFFDTTLGTTDIGLKIIKNNARTIQTILTENTQNGSRNRVMRGFAKGLKDTIYFAQEDGPWFSLDVNSNEFQEHQLIDKQTGRVIDLNCSTQLYFDKKTNFLWGITCDPNYGGGYLLKVNPTTFLTEKFRFPKKIRSFTRTKDGLFWLTCANTAVDSELFTFNPNNNRIQSYKSKEGHNPISNSYPTFINQGLNNNLWIGTLSGLFEINPSNGTINQYGVEEGFSSNSMEAFIQTVDSQLVIGTSRGLNILNTNSKEVQQILKEDGLSSNHIYSIERGEKEGTFWIGTIYGLTYYDSHAKLFKNFFERDGLSHNEFNRFSHFKDKNGKIYLGGVNGVNIFNPDDLLKTEPAPKALLTKFKFFDGNKNKPISQQTNLIYLKEITLKPNDKYLELFFSIPDYSDSKNNLYQYQLVGYDKDWNLLGKNNRVLFNSLPPDSYKLLLKGAGSKGNWSEDVYEIDIIVQQVFYKTWKFWLLCTVLLGILLQLINQYLFKQKLKVERLRTKLSSDLHDEVSGLLSGIAMQSEMLEMVTSDEKSKDKLKKISQTSRSAMSRMGDVIWSIDSRKDTVDDLLNRMSEHAMDILNPLDVAWEMKVENFNRDNKIPVLIRENLYFIFKEAINNIGKHANASKVEIKIGNIKNQFLMSIYNDSLGEKNNKISQKTGQGTANMKMRARKIEATLEINKEEGFVVILNRKRFA